MKVLDPTKYGSVAVHKDRCKALLFNKITEEAACPHFCFKVLENVADKLSHLSAPQIQILSWIIKLNALRIVRIFKYDGFYKSQTEPCFCQPSTHSVR